MVEMKESIVEFKRGPYPKNIQHLLKTKKVKKIEGFILEIEDTNNIKIEHP